MSSPTIAQRIEKDLEDCGASPELTKLLRRWLAADGDFNVWFLETTKGSLDDMKLLGLLEGYGGDQDGVEEAWEQYLVDADEGALTARLERSLEQMETLKQK